MATPPAIVSGAWRCGVSLLSRVKGMAWNLKWIAPLADSGAGAPARSPKQAMPRRAKAIPVRLILFLVPDCMIRIPRCHCHTEAVRPPPSKKRRDPLLGELLFAINHEGSFRNGSRGSGLAASDRQLVRARRNQDPRILRDVAEVARL